MSAYQEKEKMWNHIKSSLNSSGWSVDDLGEPRADVWVAKRGSEDRILWRKYSKYHLKDNRYFFSLDISWLEGLRDDRGGCPVHDARGRLRADTF